MFNRIPFKKEHAYPLLEQKINEAAKNTISDETLASLESQDTFTCKWNEEIMCCVGMSKLWHRRGFLWVLFSEHCKRNFVPLFRAAKKAIQDSDYDRVEMSIPYEMTSAKKRAELLGFKMECERALKFFPNGSDASLYAWVRE